MSYDSQSSGYKCHYENHHSGKKKEKTHPKPKVLSSSAKALFQIPEGIQAEVFQGYDKFEI